MRMTFLLATMALFPFIPGSAQTPVRLVDGDYRQFFEWFHRESQVTQLYANRSSLYIFSPNAQVHAGPSRKSAVLAELKAGQTVQNIAHSEQSVPFGQIDGYSDLWYLVTGKTPTGKPVRGYVWGADIARGWRFVDITGDSLPELIMLGLSSQPRLKPSEINAEIRIFQNGRLLQQALVPGLCIFEECDSSPLLRVLINDEQPEMVIIEASAMTISCEIGIEKVFFLWESGRLERVFHAEFTTGKRFLDRSFSIPLRDPSTGTVMANRVCRFSHEDKAFQPVWNCQVSPVLPTPTAAAERVRAR